MKKIAYQLGVLVFVIAASLAVGLSAHAQVAATMPVLYDANGNTVNTGVGPLPAGNYYLGGGPATGGHQIYYYGNGTYYDATTQTYGGSTSDPNGTSGAALNYATPTVTPGVPNTGAGGMAAYNWAILIVSGVVLAGALAYIARRAIA